MARIKRPVIVSANALLTGETVYLTETGWSADFADAAVAQLADADALLARGKADIAVVGPELSEVVETASGWAPAHRREEIRRDGPTVGALNPDLSTRHSRARQAA